MTALFLLPLSLPFTPHSRLSFSGKFRSSIPSEISRRLSRRLLAIRGSKGDKSNESLFLDEDGVVDDMDGYLDYLSLEYDSVWDTKPSWCQPWTILLTGVSVVACSWILVHSVVTSAAVFSLISAWWYIFLYLYPKAYSNMIAERRKNVSSGIEDTYGIKQSQ
ncbi:uncharacterized protein [Typha latifolia]|uniref:uncharacterized protein n=1 Tax=Typha latifolia TaxID=4733 RepID=UPI003C2E9463